MRPIDLDIQVLIDYLEGTCLTIDEGLEACFEGMDFNDLTSDDHSAIDNAIFRCDTCSWWYEVGEDSEENSGNCKDCCPDEEED